METIQSENEMELNEQDKIETTIEEVSSEEQPNNLENQESEENIDESKRLEEILKFRDELLAREILSCGVNVSENILHFGSGYKNCLILDYLSDVASQNLIPNFGIKYTAVDVDAEKINKISEINSVKQTSSVIQLQCVNDTVQSFLDNNSSEFDWAIITGIFDKKIYGDSQFDFFDKIMSESLKISNQGLILTFDISKENDEKYNINYILNYVTSIYNRYRINKINEENYIICIYKYYHSIIP